MSRPTAVLCTALLAALAATTPAGAQAPATIRLGTLAPQGTSYHRILQAMAQQWRTATNGQGQMTVYAGTMGSELELVRRMRLGQLQAGAMTGIGLKEIEPAVAGLQIMPMVYRSFGELEYVRQRLEPVLAQRLADKGFVVLFWADAGWVRFFSRRAAVRPDDFKTLKVFVTAGDNWQFDLMRSAGFQPVSLEWSDALTSLQTGMVDVLPTIPYYALAMQFHTVASNMLDLNWTPLIGATVVTKRAWDGLTPEQQAALRSAATEAGRRFQETGRAENDSAVAAMQRRGLTVVPVPPAALAEWQSTSERFYPQIRGAVVPPDIFDQVMSLLAEYRRNPRNR